MALGPLKLPRLSNNIQIVDERGYPTPTFIQWWQSNAQAIETAFNGIAAALDAAGIALEAADIAQAAADTANQAASQVTSTSALANSYVDGATISASDAGSSSTVTISAHTRVYGDGRTVAVAGGSIPGLDYETTYYIYYSDPDFADPAHTSFSPTYQYSENVNDAAQLGTIHSVGAVVTPAAAAPPNDGFGSKPPGTNYRELIDV